jgi:hypothetical protein
MLLFHEINILISCMYDDLWFYCSYSHSAFIVDEFTTIKAAISKMIHYIFVRNILSLERIDHEGIW